MATALIFNLIGLAMAGWGVSMLLGAYPRFQPVVAASITSGGLGVIALSTVWMIVLLIWGVAQRKLTSKGPELVEAATVHPLPNRERLIKAMEGLQDEALDLIERRREIHHLNIHQ